MQLEALKVFCDVVESKSFSKAAVLNFVSQSAVSQQIRSLEDRYEHRLIERGKRNLSPTPAGAALYAAAKDVLSRMEQLENRLNSMSKRVMGTVRVAAIYSVGLHELQGYMSEYMRHYPGVRVHLEFGRAGAIYEQVAANLTDIGIVAYPARRSGIRIIPFREDELALICPPGHAAAKMPRVDLQAILDEPFVAFDRTIPTRRAVDKLLRDAGVHVEIAMEFDNIETIKRAIEIGAGVSILPLPTVARETSLGTLVAVRFAKQAPTRPLGILVKRARQVPPAVQRFLDLLLEKAAPAH